MCEQRKLHDLLAEWTSKSHRDVMRDILRDVLAEWTALDEVGYVAECEKRGQENDGWKYGKWQFMALKDMLDGIPADAPDEYWETLLAGFVIGRLSRLNHTVIHYGAIINKGARQLDGETKREKTRTTKADAKHQQWRDEAKRRWQEELDSDIKPTGVRAMSRNLAGLFGARAETIRPEIAECHPSKW